MNTIDEPSSSGVALRSSTGWFAVVDESGENVAGGRLFGSAFRAAEWAAERYGKRWPELVALGFSVRGGFVPSASSDQVGEKL
jgi:hypothetical protein